MTYMTTAELVEKFRVNAEAVLAKDRARQLADRLLGLADADDVSDVVKLAGTS